MWIPRSIIQLRNTCVVFFALALTPVIAVAQSNESNPEGTVSKQVGAPPAVTVQPDLGPFARGKFRVSFSVGTSLYQRSTGYVILGAGVGYYVLDGLEVGIGTTLWLGAPPFMATISPSVTYTLPFLHIITPYLGVFFDHYFVDGRNDFDGFGARAGIHVVAPSGRLYFNVGLVYEHVLNCADAVVSCDDFYPELGVALAF